jgi:hypothetical protein
VSSSATRVTARFVTLSRRGDPVTVDTAAVTNLRDRLSEEIKKHSPTADSMYHNGGTVLALAATATATIIPYAFWAKVAAAIATFVIALARALDFGGRWRWHIEMRNSYQALLDRADELEVLPDGERLDAIKSIYDKLEALRARENGIPGAGSGGTQPSTT